MKGVRASSDEPTGVSSDTVTPVLKISRIP